MATFKSLKDVERYYNNQQNKNILGNANLKNKLESEANRLRDLIEDEIWRQMDLYEPKVYQRTYQLVSSVRVSPIQVDNEQWTIKIYFEPEYAYHHSVLGGNMGYTPELFDSGWSWKNYTGVADRFRKFEGTHFISRAIAIWEKTNRGFIRCKVEYPN